jgi:hypothetical protein
VILLLELREEADVLDGDDGLLGEDLQELDLSVWEQPGLGAGDRNRPDREAVSQHRDACGAPIAAGRRHRAEGVAGVQGDIRDLHDTSLEYCASCNGPPTWRRRIRASIDLKHLGGEAAVRHEVEELTIKLVHKAKLGLAEPSRALGDHVEHRLGVGRRPGDHPQDLGRGSLLLERLIRLVEQADILDGDDGLGGERLRAFCCSSASVSACLRATSVFRSAYDWMVGLRGPAHSSQNVACGRFSCWHRGHSIASVSRIRIVSACQGTT